MFKTMIKTSLAAVPGLLFWLGVAAQTAVIDLPTAVVDSGGLLIDGAASGDLLGWAVAGEGDFNADGVNDLALSAQGFDVPDAAGSMANAGAVYVLFGGSQALQNLDLGRIPVAGGGDGSEGFVLYGTQTNENVGSSLANAGDVNGDGIDDLLIGSPLIPNPIGGGGAYLVFGRSASQPMPAELNLQVLDTGDDTNSGFGVKFEGSQAGSSSGIDLTGNLDINADGVADMVIGNRLFSAGVRRPGLIYVIYGRRADNPWPGVFRMVNLQSNLASGDDGFGILADVADNALGSRLGNLGDFTGDGVDDLLLGSPSASASDGIANSAGFLIPGQPSAAGLGFDTGIDLALEEVRAQYHRLLGDQAEDLSGEAMAGIGDVNADGRPDLAVSAPGADHGGDDSGTVYVLFGRSAASPLPQQFDLAGLLPANGGNGSQGVVLFGSAGQGLGDAIAGAGDINGDGIDDFMIGAKSDGEGGPEAGAVYLVYGSATLPASLNVEQLAGSGRGLKLLGQGAGDKVGDRIAGALDVDRDGNPEILVGSRLTDQAGSNAGRVYLINGEGGSVSGFTGADSRAWFDPARPGEGIMIEVGTLNSTPTLFASWYTYQNNEQLWLVGGPAVFQPGQSELTTELFRTSGTGFGDAFDADEVVLEQWGSVTITRLSCGQLSWQYTGPDAASSGQRQFVPLLSSLLALDDCTDGSASKLLAEQPVNSQGVNLGVGHAGAWYDPARGGEGVLVDLELRGDVPTAFISWFTYNGGQQRWLVGSGPFDPASGQISALQLVETRGTGFGADFDPAEVVTLPWGALDLSFSACQGLVLSYSGAFEGATVQTGSASLVRFTGPLYELNCP